MLLHLLLDGWDEFWNTAEHGLTPSSHQEYPRTSREGRHVVDNIPVWAYLVSAVLGSGLFSALVSWRVSLGVGSRQAKATVDAARVQAESHLQAAKQDAEAMMRSAREQSQASYDAAIDHAIRGEKLKLRASIM